MHIHCTFNNIIKNDKMIKKKNKNEKFFIYKIG